MYICIKDGKQPSNNNPDNPVVCLFSLGKGTNEMLPNDVSVLGSHNEELTMFTNNSILQIGQYSLCWLLSLWHPWLDCSIIRPVMSKATTEREDLNVTEVHCSQHPFFTALSLKRAVFPKPAGPKGITKQCLKTNNKGWIPRQPRTESSG